MKHIVFLTGSGISAESGIPTFRGNNGLWNNYLVEDVADIRGYQRDREKVIKFYNELRNEFKDCKPNKAHELIAKLEDNPDIKVTVVTQNVDNLHEQAGSTNVIHLHGDVTKATSSKNPNDEKCIVPLNSDIHIGDKAADGSQLRPYIVWFGEPVLMYKVAEQIMHTADICVIIGTSLQVHPACDLAYEVPVDKQIYIIDPNDVKFDDMGMFEICPWKHIKKVATEGMEEIYNLITNNK